MVFFSCLLMLNSTLYMWFRITKTLSVHTFFGPCCKCKYLLVEQCWQSLVAVVLVSATQRQIKSAQLTFSAHYNIVIITYLLKS